MASLEVQEYRQLEERHKKSTEIERPIQKLRPLEVSGNEDDHNKDYDKETQADTKDENEVSNEASCNRPDLVKTPTKFDKSLRDRGIRLANLRDDLKQTDRSIRPIRQAAIDGQQKRRSNDE